MVIELIRFHSKKYNKFLGYNFFRKYMNFFSVSFFIFFFFFGIVVGKCPKKLLISLLTFIWRKIWKTDITLWKTAKKRVTWWYLFRFNNIVCPYFPKNYFILSQSSHFPYHHIYVLQFIQPMQWANNCYHVIKKKKLKKVILQIIFKLLWLDHGASPISLYIFAFC